MDAWANVAALTKAKNREGGLFVQSTKGLPFLLECGMPVAFVPPVLRVPRFTRVQRIEETSKGYLVFFEGITTQTDAEALVGHYCLVPEANLPEGWDDAEEASFIGFDVFVVDDGAEVAAHNNSDTSNKATFPSWYVGRVVDIEENPAHPLLVVTMADTGREVYIPLVEEFIVLCTPEEGTLVLQLPAGLLDL